LRGLSVVKSGLAIGLLLFALGRLNAEDCRKECVSGNCESGRGVQTYANCDKYDGDFAHGKRDGQGEYSFFNGDVYRGGFREGKRANKGQYFFKRTNTQAEQFVFETNLDENGEGAGVLKSGKATVQCSIRAGMAECGEGSKLLLVEKS